MHFALHFRQDKEKATNCFFDFLRQLGYPDFASCPVIKIVKGVNFLLTPFFKCATIVLSKYKKFPKFRSTI